MTHTHIFLLISKAKAVSTFSKAVHERRGQISGAKRSAAPTRGRRPLCSLPPQVIPLSGLCPHRLAGQAGSRDERLAPPPGPFSRAPTPPLPSFPTALRQRDAPSRPSRTARVVPASCWVFRGRRLGPSGASRCAGGSGSGPPSPSSLPSGAGIVRVSLSAAPPPNSLVCLSFLSGLLSARFSCRRPNSALPSLVRLLLGPGFHPAGPPGPARLPGSSCACTWTRVRALACPRWGQGCELPPLTAAGSVAAIPEAELDAPSPWAPALASARAPSARPASPGPLAQTHAGPHPLDLRVQRVPPGTTLLRAA